jgi:hypothetical protein
MDSAKRRRGRPPRGPQVRLTPTLKDAVRRSALTRGMLALMAAFPQQGNVSFVIRPNHTFALTPLMRSRLQKLAEILHVPQDQIFIEVEPEVQR